MFPHFLSVPNNRYDDVDDDKKGDYTSLYL